MEFKSPYKHGQKQLEMLKKMLLKEDLKEKEVCFLIAEMSANGFDNFLECYDNLYKKIKSNKVKKFLNQKKQEWVKIKKIRNLKILSSDKELVKELYLANKPVFYKSNKNPKKLLIVFTTMYNNFYFANFVLLSLLLELGVNILILKDDSLFNYLKGIPGLGSTFNKSVLELNQFIKKNSVNEVYISGFSSGGYASLMMSTLIPCQGYLGFSITSDISSGSSLPSSKFFTPKIANQLDPALRLDMAELFEKGSHDYKKKIIYGEKTVLDKKHAEKLLSVGGFESMKIKGCGHLTPLALFEKDKLLDEFRALVF